MYWLNTFVLTLLLPWSLCSPASAAAPATAPLALHYGSNSFAVGSGGETALAMLGHRDNFNAHGFDMLTLYIKPAAPIAGVGDWQLVTFFDGDKETFDLSSGGGADCLLHDFRLVPSRAHGDPSLIVAQRDFGASYADAAPVHFKQYALHRNVEGTVGRPFYYFKLERSMDARHPYCDVGEAFEKELGIKPYR